MELKAATKNWQNIWNAEMALYSVGVNFKQHLVARWRRMLVGLQQLRQCLTHILLLDRWKQRERQEGLQSPLFSVIWGKKMWNKEKSTVGQLIHRRCQKSGFLFIPWEDTASPANTLSDTCHDMATASLLQAPWICSASVAVMAEANYLLHWGFEE